MANNSELEDILRLRLAGLLANEQISALFGLDDDDFDPTNDFDPLAEMDDMFGDIDHFVEDSSRGDNSKRGSSKPFKCQNASVREAREAKSRLDALLDAINSGRP